MLKYKEQDKNEEEERKGNKKKEEKKKSKRGRPRKILKPEERPTKNVEISSDELSLESRRKRKREEDKINLPESSENESEKINDSDHIIEYDRDIIFGKLMKKIGKLIK